MIRDPWKDLLDYIDQSLQSAGQAKDQALSAIGQAASAIGPDTTTPYQPKTSADIQAGLSDIVQSPLVQAVGTGLGFGEVPGAAAPEAQAVQQPDLGTQAFNREQFRFNPQRRLEEAGAELGRAWQTGQPQQVAAAAATGGVGLAFEGITGVTELTKNALGELVNNLYGERIPFLRQVHQEQGPDAAFDAYWRMAQDPNSPLGPGLWNEAARLPLVKGVAEGGPFNFAPEAGFVGRLPGQGARAVGAGTRTARAAQAAGTVAGAVLSPAETVFMGAVGTQTGEQLVREQKAAEAEEQLLLANPNATPEEIQAAREAAAAAVTPEELAMARVGGFAAGVAARPAASAAARGVRRVAQSPTGQAALTARQPAELNLGLITGGFPGVPEYTPERATQLVQRAADEQIEPITRIEQFQDQDEAGVPIGPPETVYVLGDTGLVLRTDPEMGRVWIQQWPPPPEGSEIIAKANTLAEARAKAWNLLQTGVDWKQPYEWRGLDPSTKLLVDAADRQPYNPLAFQQAQRTFQGTPELGEEAARPVAAGEVPIGAQPEPGQVPLPEEAAPTPAAAPAPRGVYQRGKRWYVQGAPDRPFADRKGAEAAARIEAEHAAAATPAAAAAPAPQWQVRQQAPRSMRDQAAAIFNALQDAGYDVDNNRWPAGTPPDTIMERLRPIAPLLEDFRTAVRATGQKVPAGNALLAKARQYVERAPTEAGGRPPEPPRPPDVLEAFPTDDDEIEMRIVAQPDGTFTTRLWNTTTDAQYGIDGPRTFATPEEARAYVLEPETDESYARDVLDVALRNGQGQISVPPPQGEPFARQFKGERIGPQYQAILDTVRADAERRGIVLTPWRFEFFQYAADPATQSERLGRGEAFGGMAAYIDHPVEPGQTDWHGATYDVPGSGTVTVFAHAGHDRWWTENSWGGRATATHSDFLRARSATLAADADRLPAAERPGVAGAGARGAQAARPEELPRPGEGERPGERAGPPGAALPEAGGQPDPNGRPGVDGVGPGTPRGPGAPAPELETPPTPGPNVDPSRPDVKLGQNYRVSDGDAAWQSTARPRERFAANMDAIRRLKELEASRAEPTVEDLQAFARYSGMGDSAFNDAFPSPSRDKKKNPDRDLMALGDELRGLLTEDEWTALADSRLNAMYTSPTVIGHMWQALRRLGIEGLNRVQLLEPAAGIGRFLGLIPDQLQPKVAMTAVELDNITGGLLRHLYSQADVHAGIGFEDAPIARGSIDVAISNVPFGAFKVIDVDYLNEPYLRTIHNYFFKKTLDKLRPGGVLAFITSRYTLDGYAEDAVKFRSRIAQEGDLLLSVRLPQDTFPDTHVETDIIFMQKRETPLSPEEARRLPWVEAPERTVTHDDGSQVTVHRNAYYDANPDHLLGREAAGRGQFSPTDYKLVKDAARPWDTGLPQVLARLPENVLLPAEVQISSRIDPGIGVEGSYTIQNGQVMVSRGGKLVKQMFHVSDGTQRVKAMLDLNDKGMTVLELQRAGAPDHQVVRAQQALVKAYDAYVRKWLPLNDVANRRVMGDDPRGFFLRSLEKWNDTARRRWDSEGRKKAAAKADLDALKADIFSKRLLRAGRAIDKAETPKDGLMISLNEAGKLDLARISSLVGKSIDDVADDLLRQGLIYLDPKGGVVLDPDVTGRNYVLADDYLSGNVREKLKAAEQAAARNNWFAPNAEALRLVQPKDLLPSEISVELGVGWIPASDVNQFVKDLLGAERYRDIRADWFSYVPANADWSAEGIRGQGWWQDYAKQREWGTDNVPAMSLIEDILNSRPTRVVDRDTKQLLEEPTRLAESKKLEIREEFGRWVWADPERAGRLAAYYNENINVYRTREWDGSHLTFEGTSDIGLFPHQKAAVWRIIQTGSALLAHEVGFGKTYTMAAAAMELRRLGLVRKSMMVTPNSVVSQFAAQFQKLYPMARLLVPTEADFTPARRNVLMARIATGDWDAVIVPQSQFSLLELNPQTQLDMLRTDLREVETIAQEYANENHIDWNPALEDQEQFRGPRNQDQTFKQLRKMVRDMKAKIRTQNARLKKWKAAHVAGALSFEELGVDQVFVDEADLYKNLGFPTKMGSIKGLSTTHSLRAGDMYDKVRWLQQQQGGRGVVFATGTPISNSIAELWTMMRYLSRPELERLSMQHFDAWAKTYGQAYPSFETTITGKNKMLYRFSRFVNAPELSAMFQGFADVRMSVDVPEMEELKPRMQSGARIAVTIGSTDWHKGYQKHLSDRADALDPRDRVTDNMLKITNDARKASLDPTLVGGPDLPNSKLQQSADRIFDVWQAEKADRGTQLVFMDLGTPKDRANVETDEYPPELKSRLQGVTDEEQQRAIIDDYFDEYGEDAAETQARDSVYEKLKAMLVARGIPEQEVMFVHQAKNKAQLESLFDLVNTGEVRVLFGSTEKMGAGVNVQRRLAAVHHMDTPWRPRDIEQREGRILRQGNEVYGPTLEVGPDGALVRDEGGLPRVASPGKGVRVYTYVTEWPFDAYLWSTVLAKWKAIKSMMRREVTERTVDEADEGTMDAARFRMLAQGDPWGLRLLQVEDAGKTLRARERAHTNARAEAGLRVAQLPEQIARYTAERAQYEQDAAVLDAMPDGGKRGLAWQIDGATYTREEAGAHLIEAAIREIEVMRASEATSSPLGTVDGWPLALFYSRTRDEASFKVQGPSGAVYGSTDLPDRAEASAEGFLQRVENARLHAHTWARSGQEAINKAQADLLSAQKYLDENQVWSGAQDLENNKRAASMIRSRMAEELWTNEGRIPAEQARVPTDEDLEAAVRGEQIADLMDSAPEAAAAATEAQHQAEQPPAEPKFEQASTQIDLVGVPTLHEIMGGQGVRPEDVISLEDKPHLTVLYGLRPDSEDAIRQAVADLGPFDIQLGPTAHFKADADRPESDVVYASIEANDKLSALRKALEDADVLAVEPREYVPHVTLAYVQPGTGERYSGHWTNRMGKPIHVDRLSLTDTQGNPIEIRLGETPTRPKQGRVTDRETDLRTREGKDAMAKRVADRVNELYDAGKTSAAEIETELRADNTLFWLRQDVEAIIAAREAMRPAEEAVVPAPEPLTPEGRAAAIATIQDFLVRSKGLARNDVEVISVAVLHTDDMLRDQVGGAKAWLDEHPETTAPTSPIDNPPPLEDVERTTALAQIEEAYKAFDGKLRLTGAMVSPEDRARVTRYEKLLAELGYEVLERSTKRNTTTITFDKPMGVDPRPAWQQTRAEFRLEHKGYSLQRVPIAKVRPGYAETHRAAVEAAVARGDLVRDSIEGLNILADYPDLVRQWEAAEKAEKKPDINVPETPGDTTEAAPKPAVTPTPQVATGVDGTTKYVLPSFVTQQQRGDGRKSSPNQTPRPEGDAIAEPATAQAETLGAELETPPAPAATVPTAAPTTPPPAGPPPTAETAVPSEPPVTGGPTVPPGQPPPPQQPPAPPTPPVPPPPPPTGGTDGPHHRVRSGYWHPEMPGTVLDAIDRGWDQYGQVKEVMTHDDWLNEAAKLTGQDVNSIASRWRGVDAGRMASDLTALRAGVLQTIRELQETKRDIDSGIGDQAALTARLEDLTATYEHLWLGMTRASTEHARALNSLQIQMQLAHLIEASEYWQIRKQVHLETKQKLTTLVQPKDGAPLNGDQLAELERLRKQLEAIADGKGGYTPDSSAVDEVLDGHGPAVNGKTPLVKTPRAEPRLETDPDAERTAREVRAELWDQFLDLNQQIMDARRAGNHAEADAIFSERVEVLAQLADETLADMQAKLESDNIPEDLTLDEWKQAVSDKLKARAKAQAQRMLNEGIRQSISPDELGGLARGMPEQKRLDLLTLIAGELGLDPHTGRVGPSGARPQPTWLRQTSAAIQKKMLSSLDRERAMNVVQIEQARLKALANGDTRAEARLREQRDTELAALEQRVRGQIDAQVQRAPEDKELRRMAAGLTRRLKQAIEASKTDADALTNLYRDPLQNRTLNGVDRSLAAQLLELRNRMVEARATGDPNLDTLQQLHDQVLVQLRGKIEERQRKRADRPQITDTEKAQRAAERKLERDLEREMLGKAAPEPADSELAVMVRDALKRIDRIIKAQERDSGFLKDAKGLLDNLAELGGYAERKSKAYQRRVAEAQLLRVFTRPDWKALTDERRKALLKMVDWTDPRSAASLARMMVRPGIWNQVHAIRVASLLSGTSTQLVNMLGNFIMYAQAPLERLGAAIGEDIVTIRGIRRPREAYYSQVMAELSGMLAAWPKALQDAKVTWATGISTRQMRDLRTQYSGLITWGPFRPLNLVFRGMATMDDLFYSLAHSSAMASEIERTARRTGRSYAEVRENILDYPGVLERSAKEADRRIFQQELEGWYRGINQMRDNPAVAWMLPFLRTTINLARVGAGLTPYGFVRGERKRRAGDLAMAAEERGRAIIGTLALTAVGYLASQGLVTGGGPSDDQKKRQLLEQGWTPYSFKIGDTYVPYQNLMGHWTLPIALAATMVETMGPNVEPGTLDKNAAMLNYFVRNFGGVFLQQSGMVAIRDAMEAITDPERHWDSFVDNQLSSMVPYRGFLAAFARTMDPMMKDPQNPLDALMMGIPGLSQMVPAKLTAYGEPRPHAGPGIWSFTPVRPSAFQADPETAELLRTGAPLVTKPDRTVGERILTPTEQRALQVAQGTKVRLALRTLFESPGYRDAPDKRKKIMAEDAKSLAREAALEEMGLQPPPEPSTLPPKYRGVGNPALQAEIDESLRIASAYDRDPAHALPPTERQLELATAYRDEDLVNPAYRQATQAQTAASSAARGDIRRVITPEAFANLDGPHQQSLQRAATVKQQTDQMPRYIWRGQSYGTAQQWDAWDDWLGKWRALPASSAIKKRYAREGQTLEIMQNQRVLAAQLGSGDYQRWYGIGRSLSDEQWAGLQQIPRYADRQGRAVGTPQQWAEWDAWLKTWNVLPRLDPRRLQTMATARQLKRLVNPAFRRYVKEADYLGVYGTSDLATETEAAA